MIQYDWNFARLLIYRDAFISGVAFTVELSVATIVFSTILGVAMGVTMTSNKALRVVLFPFIDILKAIPPLVIVLFGYFFFTREVVGVTVPGFIAFTLSLGLNVGAFIADLTRAAISNVSSEYIDWVEPLDSQRALGTDTLLRLLP
jgi:His/Glu/Gln/Arg/opine family amino acid ABC transporter permease subunit